MSANFYNLLKYAETGIASPEMTYFDKMRALSMAGGGTIKTLTGIPPLSFIGNGKPLISLSMLGNAQQTGTPSPDNIIMPTFCGVRTGNLAASVDLTTSNNIHIRTNKSEMMPNTPYSLSFYSDNTFKGNSIYLTAYNPGYSRIIGTISGSGLVSSTFSLTDGDVSAIDGASSYSIRIFKSETDFSKTKNVMLNLGSTALPYEPYGYKIPLTCAGQTVPVYLGQVSTVRKIKKLVFDGTESWAAHASQANVYTLYSINDYLHAPSPVPLCSHYRTQITASAGSVEDKRVALYYNQTQLSTSVFYIKDTDIATVSDLKSYLAAKYAAGTPVTVWYVLATPETGIVNEPLAKIGDYADELHSSDAAVTIPTANGDNTLTVDTDLQPSSMTITGHIK